MRLNDLAKTITQQPIKLSRALLVLVVAPVLAIVAALLVAVSVSNVGGHAGYERVSFAIPATAQPRVPWDSEVDAFGHKVSQAFGIRRSTATEFAGWILEASERQRLEPELLASLVLTESSFRKNVRSHVGAIGPTQVRPEFWGRFCGSPNLHDAAENIYCGAQVLAYLKTRCGDYGCALQAYNIGLYSKQFSAGRRYLAKIDRARDQLRNISL